MIKSYKLDLQANNTKLDNILEIAKEYRKTARVILYTQLNLLYKEGKINKFHKLNINSKLNARYLQTIQRHVVGMLNSYLSNRKNDFIKKVSRSNLDEDTKTKLYYINKHKKWFSKEVLMQKKPIEDGILKLARTIIKRTFKKNRFPNTKYINMQLDNNVAKIESKLPDKATSFDYWIKLSTLTKGKPILLPTKSNPYFEDIEGRRLNFCQINIDNDNNISIVFMKDVPKGDYISRTDKIGLDLGLSNLFASDRGDLFGRRFIDYLLKMDKKITKLQSRIQKNGLKLSKSTRYKKLVKKMRAYLKNEIHRIINRIIYLYAPKEIVIERLNFQSPKLSKRMNRILQNFGKSIIRQKLDMLKEEFGIKITEINPAYTSQTCSHCGYVDKNNRKSQAEFVCEFCKKKQNSDINAAKNILVRSSDEKLSSIYIRKATILNELACRFIERYSKQVCSRPVIQSNPYFEGLINADTHQRDGT